MVKLGAHKTLLKNQDTHIVDAHESARTRIGKTQSSDHEELLGEKGFNSLSCYNLVHKPIPILQAMEIPDAEAAVDKW